MPLVIEHGEHISHKQMDAADCFTGWKRSLKGFLIISELTQILAVQS